MDHAPVSAPLSPVFTVGEGLAAGLSSHLLRSQRLETPTRGLRMWAGSTPQWQDLSRALCQLEGEHCLSHTTAARWWGIGLPSWMHEDHSVHVTGRQGFSGARRRPGVVGHRAKLEPQDVVETGGLRLTSPARTWLDLAPMLTDPMDLIAAGDALLQRADGPPRGHRLLGRRPLAHWRDIDEVLERRGSVKGIVAARHARPLLREGVDSAPESRMRSVVVAAGLPEPVVNPVVVLAPGVARRPDLALLEWQIALQYDGAHHAETQQINRDIFRDDDFDRHRWRTVRAGRDLYRPSGERSFLERLRRAMHAQQKRGMGPR